MNVYLRDLKISYEKRLDNMRHCNKMKKDLITKTDNIKKDLDGCKNIINNIKDILIIAMNQQNLYSQSMVSRIEETLQYSIGKVASNKKYGIKLQSSTYRNRNILKPYLVDENGVLLPPKILEGDMLNQVFSFSTVAIIALKSGYSRVYYDEAFASANPRSQVIIRELIKDYVSLGINFVFVSQSPILLAGIDRHVIELISDGNKIASINEYDIDSEMYNKSSDEYIINLLDCISKGEDINEFLNNTK